MLFALFIAATSLCVVVQGQAQPVQQSTVPKLGNILKDAIYNAVLSIAQYLAQYVLCLADPNSSVLVEKFPTALKQLSKPTVQTVVAKLLSLYKADGTSVLKQLAKSLVNAPVDVNNVIGYISAFIKPGTAITFADAVNLIGGYFVLFATYFYVGLLNE